MMKKALLLSLVCCSTVLAQVLDTSGCKPCLDRYTIWRRKRLPPTFWTSTNDHTKAADTLCSEAKELYNGCWMTCAKDANGNQVPNYHENAVILNEYLTNYCTNHACRLADTEGCRKTSAVCSNQHAECLGGLFEKKKCRAERLCDKEERAAYSQQINDGFVCSLSSNYLKKEGYEATNQMVDLGLQACEDVVVVKCLEDWHVDPPKKDYGNFRSMSDNFKAKFCSKEYMSTLNKCFTDAVNGSIVYANATLRAPCNLEYMNPDSIGLMTSTMTNVLRAIETICSNSQAALCSNSSAAASAQGNTTLIADNTTTISTTATGDAKPSSASAAQKSGDEKTETPQNDKVETTPKIATNQTSTIANKVGVGKSSTNSVCKVIASTWLSLITLAFSFL